MKLAIVGAGKMGGAILMGALQTGVLQAGEVGIYHPDAERLEVLAGHYGVAALDDEGIHRAERVLIAVKPQSFDAVAPLIARRNASYISLMAGVSSETVARRVGSLRVVRAMPNLGARVGQSATALSALAQATPEDIAMAEQLFGAVGTVHHLPERLFDAFTGLAGSGPAYAAVFAEALADGGVRVGFGRELATSLARQVLLAAARLLEEEPPAELKNEVASAGGTAIAGIMALEHCGLRYAVMKAVEDAAARAAALSR
ncbi:MAG TPA: pyrroline-5-carboxylate reductase, partial [Trueperaceae bacterium]